MDKEVENEIADSRSAMEAAWDAAEEKLDGQGAEAEVLESASDEAESGDTGQPSEDADEVQPEGEPDGAGTAAELSGESRPAAGENASLDTPPKGLSPAAREAWKETPEAVRADIARREADYAKGIEKHRANTERVKAMDQALAPFQQYMAVNGGPQQTIGTLLQTGAMLQMGNPTQKAQLVANMIKEFGVDIKALDSLLVGEQPQADPNSQIDQLLQQKLQPLQQQLQRYQQQEQQAQMRSQQQIQSEVDQFAQQNEFYDDVKMEMADLLDMAANRGRQMTMQEAYEIACSTNPQISKIRQARSSQQVTQQRRAAASSVRGTRGSDGGTQAPSSTRAALEAAWDNAGRM